MVVLEPSPDASDELFNNVKGNNASQFGLASRG
jgi:hypothetical protein